MCMTEARLRDERSMKWMKKIKTLQRASIVGYIFRPLKLYIFRDTQQCLQMNILSTPLKHVRFKGVEK